MRISEISDEERNEEAHSEQMAKTGFWGKRAAGCLFQARDTGRILFALRSGAVLEPHTYGTWGGAIDEGEDPVDAVIREAEEEAGVEISRSDIHPMYVFDVPGKFRYLNFLAVVDREFDPVLNWESEGFEWVDFGLWPTPLHPGAKHLVFDDASLATMRKLYQGEG